VREPRYVAIADDLMSRVAAGEWPVGDLLPTEPELAADYQVSRETLRRALHRMEARGLISRHPGTGTRVERARPAAAYTARLGSLRELTQYGGSAVRSVLSVEDVSIGPELAVTTGLPAGARRKCITSVRRDPEHADRIISWAQVYLEPEDAAAVEQDLGEKTLLISDLLEARTGRAVDRVVQEIKAVGVPAEAASALGVAPGSPGLLIVRRYYDAADRLFEVSASVHTPDTFVYATTLQRS